jgi:hypothetical protein
MVVSLETPQEMAEDGREGVSLWLYRVVRDDQRLNDPARRVGPSSFAPPPLPLRLHYLVTPITNRENLGDPDTEQYLIGKVIQSLHSHPILRGADLRAELLGTEAQLHVRLETLELEALARIWDALEGSYQLSVSYEVSLVDIDTAREPDSLAPVMQVVAELGPIVATT